MNRLWNFLTVASLFVIGYVVIGGIGDTYEFFGLSVLPGGMLIVAALAVLGGSNIARFAYADREVDTAEGTTTERRPQPLMIGLSALLFVAAVVVLVTGGSQVILEDLAVGDCFDETPIGEIQSVPLVPCEEPHDLEVYAIVVLGTATEPFPGQAAVDEEGAFACLDRFEAFIGISYQQSALDISFITPSPESWEIGDRTVICSVYRLDGQKLVGTARDSGI